MARSDLLALAVIAATILAVTCDENKNVNEMTPVTKCWKCSSNAPGFEFCNDPFDESKITEAQRALHYIVCPPPPNRSSPQPGQKVVCRKLKQTENDTIVVHRMCYWQEVNQPKPCENANLPSHITVESCDLCDNVDGCNGALQYGPVAMFIAIPMIVANILLL